MRWICMWMAVALACRPVAASPPAAPITIRVATFNLGDVATRDLADAGHPRLRRLAEVIQRVRPTVLFLNEIAYDMPGAPGHVDGEAPGGNAQRFADLYLAVPQAEGLRPLRYRAFTAPTNTGIASGFDLDNDGEVVTTFPALAAPSADGAAARATPEGVKYGNDCWGFGTYPGQYGMALLVDERLTIDAASARTFQRMPWEYMSGALMPKGADGAPWFDAEERALVRLSSKSHWDVPVVMPNGRRVHLLCSHPTPPVFDGPEDRNGRRNHDETRFWMDYVENAGYIVDDANVGGGLPLDASFVVVGDLNADPDEGESFKDPIGLLLGSAARINTAFVPLAEVGGEGRLDRDDTAVFGLRVDYVLPSIDLETRAGGVWRATPGGGIGFPSDHFPVWVDLVIPPPDAPE